MDAKHIDNDSAAQDADFDAEAAEGLSDEGYIAATEAAAAAGGRDEEFDLDAAAGLSDEDYQADLG